MNVAMADGSVHFINDSIPGTTWWIAVVPNDGIPLPNDWNN
jgi:hypothetical protein